jgi:outer membrane protein TolC
METLPFTGAALLEERSTSGAEASGNSTREDLLQIREDADSVMAKLENPPTKYADAYEQLREMYALYEKLSDSLLESPMPQQLPEVEIKLLAQRFDYLRQTLKILNPAAASQ